MITKNVNSEKVKKHLRTFLLVHFWPKVPLPTSTHTLWGTESSSYEDNRYRIVDRIPVAPFVFIFDYDRFEKKYHDDFLPLFTSNMTKVCIAFFLDTLSAILLFLETVHTNVRKLYHTYLINSLDKKKLGKNPTHIQLAFICKSIMTDTNFFIWHHADRLILPGIQPKAPGVLINSLQWRKW